MESVVLQYGFVGVCVVILSGVIIWLYKEQQKKDERMLKEFDDLRKWVREEFMTQLESTQSTIIHCNHLMEETSKLMNEIRILLSRYWEGKL